MPVAHRPRTIARADAPELSPGNLVAHLVAAASGSVIDGTVVDGRVLMRDREDEEEVRARTVACARRLGVLWA